MYNVVFDVMIKLAAHPLIAPIVTKQIQDEKDEDENDKVRRL